MLKAFNTLAYTIKRMLDKNNSYRHTYRELNNLTNKELADIGISRWDIHRLATEHAEKSHA